MTKANEKQIEKTLKAIMKIGKYTVGLKESTKSLKNAKLLVYSDSLDNEIIAKIKKSCKSSSIPAISFSGSSVALGRLCGKPFRVTAMSVRSAGDIDLTFFREVDLNLSI